MCFQVNFVSKLCFQVNYNQISSALNLWNSRRLEFTQIFTDEGTLSKFVVVDSLAACLQVRHEFNFSFIDLILSSKSFWYFFSLLASCRSSHSSFLKRDWRLLKPFRTSFRSAIFPVSASSSVDDGLLFAQKVLI